MYDTFVIEGMAKRNARPPGFSFQVRPLTTPTHFGLSTAIPCPLPHEISNTCKTVVHPNLLLRLIKLQKTVTLILKSFKSIYHMKRILKNTGADTNKNGIDYLEKFRKTSPSLIKRSSLEDLTRRVEQSRIQKLKKAS